MTMTCLDLVRKNLAKGRLCLQNKPLKIPAVSMDVEREQLEFLKPYGVYNYYYQTRNKCNRWTIFGVDAIRFANLFYADLDEPKQRMIRRWNRQYDHNML